MMDAYDLIVIGLSGGKDSTALMLYAMYESGWPVEKIAFVFCDTGNEDPLTYAYIKMLSEHVHQIHHLDPGVDFYTLAQQRGRFPSTKRRFCTQVLKIDPKHKMFAELFDAGLNPINVTGIRHDEAHNGNDRGETLYVDYEQFMHDGRYYTLPNCNPLIDWTLGDVWNIHKKYLSVDLVAGIIQEDSTLEYKDLLLERLYSEGIPANPLYLMGASRVGCFPCINSRKGEIRSIAKYRPSRIDFIRQQELHPAFRKGISTLFPRKRVPMQFRSKKIVAKSGEEMYVCTIDDVVAWSATSWGGKQIEADYMEEPSICRIGQHCE